MKPASDTNDCSVRAMAAQAATGNSFPFSTSPFAIFSNSIQATTVNE